MKDFLHHVWFHLEHDELDVFQLYLSLVHLQLLYHTPTQNLVLTYLRMRWISLPLHFTPLSLYQLFHDKLYYVRDEQWTKLTAKDMRTALVNAKSEQRISSRTLMPSFNTSPSSAPIRSPMTMELASFKKSIKREASAYSVLKDERFFDKFQRDLIITAKSHDVSEILDPSYSPGHSPEERELF